MEIEIKLTLTQADAAKLKTLLHPTLKSIDQQINVFLDTEECQLEKMGTVLRLRQSLQTSPSEGSASPDVSWWLAIKSKPVLANGINHVAENEAIIDTALAESLLRNPETLSSKAQCHPLLQSLPHIGPYRLLGSYQTLRHTYPFGDVFLELDETLYASGVKRYELECETDDPERIKLELTRFLAAHGVQATDSRSNKFAQMRNECPVPSLATDPLQWIEIHPHT